MKRKVTSRADVAGWIANRLVLVSLSFFISCAAVFGQNTGDHMGIGDLSGITWKAPAELTATISDEQSKMDVALTTPDLLPADRALYLSYKRLLAYLQDDLQAAKPMEEAIPSNYEKVVTEAPKDVDLKHLNPDVFITMIPGLIEAMAEVPAPGQ